MIKFSLFSKYYWGDQIKGGCHQQSMWYTLG
jgi:hypothetical protein